MRWRPTLDKHKEMIKKALETKSARDVAKIIGCPNTTLHTFIRKEFGPMDHSRATKLGNLKRKKNKQMEATNG